jgi:hypothetical protein
MENKEMDNSLKTTEVREVSNEEVWILHKTLVLIEKPSIHGKGIKHEASPRRGENSKEGMKTFSTCETNIKGVPKGLG